VAKHDDARRKCAQPRDGWIPNYGRRVFFVPPDHDVGCRKIRSQYNGLHLDGDARVSDTHAMLGVPRQRELRADFSRLHGLSSAVVAKYDDARRKCAKSRDIRVPFDSRGMFFMPSDHDLGGRQVRSQHNGISSNQQAHHRAM
jgi:hypothetical protein